MGTVSINLKMLVIKAVVVTATGAIVSKITEKIFEAVVENKEKVIEVKS